jgi:serine phosphatase RsbU (regulator of sigma subunit)
VVTWVAGERGRRFSHDDLSFGVDLARRAATAIDNAQLHSQVRDVAIQLQRAVLPSTLPDMPGWEVAVRYLPAGRTDVGGDFYDVVPLVDGRVVAFVGDVMGRGVAAASAMAQMRSALRTLIAIDPDPVIVMAGLDRLFDQYDLNRLVTVAYAVMDPGRDEVHVTNAGHPPPLLLRRDGGSSDIAADGALLLGAGGGDREVVTRTMFPGDTLLMFTDGLVERREENLEDGHRRVHDATHLLAEPDLEQGLRELVNVMHDETRDDDVAALALRRTWSATR